MYVEDNGRQIAHTFPMHAWLHEKAGLDMKELNYNKLLDMYTGEHKLAMHSASPSRLLVKMNVPIKTATMTQIS